MIHNPTGFRALSAPATRILVAITAPALSGVLAYPTTLGTVRTTRILSDPSHSPIAGAGATTLGPNFAALAFGAFAAERKESHHVKFLLHACEYQLAQRHDDSKAQRLQSTTTLFPMYLSLLPGEIFARRDCQPPASSIIKCRILSTRYILSALYVADSVLLSLC